MLAKYIFFCLGASLVIGAWSKSPGPGGVSAMDAPFWMSTKTGKIALSVIALLFWAAEIILGIVFVSIWAGLILWLPAALIMSALLPGNLLAKKNPAIPFFIGLLIAAAAAISFFI